MQRDLTVGFTSSQGVCRVSSVEYEEPRLLVSAPAGCAQPWAPGQQGVGGSRTRALQTAIGSWALEGPCQNTSARLDCLTVYVKVYYIN